MSLPTPESAPASESSPALSKWRPRLYKLLRVGVYLVVALFLFLAFLPMGLRMGAEYWLNKQPGIAAAIGNIDLNLLFSKNIEIERIKTYADWFFNNELIPHFELEEAHIFPILKADNELVKRALAEHRRLKRLFNDEKDVERSLHKIEEELEQHIRFEERILFPEIQKTATEAQLALIEDIHHEEGFVDNVNDEFWI